MPGFPDLRTDCPRLFMLPGETEKLLRTLLSPPSRPPGGLFITQRKCAQTHASERGRGSSAENTEWPKTFHPNSPDIRTWLKCPNFTGPSVFQPSPTPTHLLLQEGFFYSLREAKARVGPTNTAEFIGELSPPSDSHCTILPLHSQATNHCGRCKRDDG